MWVLLLIFITPLPHPTTQTLTLEFSNQKLCLKAKDDAKGLVNSEDDLTLEIRAVCIKK